MTRLATRTTSVLKSATTNRRRHLARIHSTGIAVMERSPSRRKNVGNPGPPHNLGMARYTNLVMIFGYTHGEYLMARMTPSPNLMMMIMDAMQGAVDLAAEGKAKMTSARRMDKTNQGPKRAVAEAIDHPQQFQPGTYSAGDSSSKGPIARICSHKSYVFLLVLRRCPEP
jgi:hypothetical protein